MQTFLPYPSFSKSLECLDNRRLGKQRVESIQLITTILSQDLNWKQHPACVDWNYNTGTRTIHSFIEQNVVGGLRNHPAALMWKDHVDALILYYNWSIEVWEDRGFRNTLQQLNHRYGDATPPLPKWFGDAKFHSSHRSNLLRKDPVHYGKFGWKDDPEAPYIWPTKTETLPATSAK